MSLYKTCRLNNGICICIMTPSQKKIKIEAFNFLYAIQCTQITLQSYLPISNIFVVSSLFICLLLNVSYATRETEGKKKRKKRESREELNIFYLFISEKQMKNTQDKSQCNKRFNGIPNNSQRIQHE